MQVQRRVRARASTGALPHSQAIVSAKMALSKEFDGNIRNYSSMEIGESPFELDKKNAPMLPLKSTITTRPHRNLWSTPIFALLFVALFFLSTIAAWHIVNVKTAPKCLGAPYLYMTHQGNKNLLKFSRDGCLITEKALWGNYQKSDFRGMTIGSYNGKEALFLADVGTYQVMIFGTCSGITGLRSYLTTAVSMATNKGVQHPYGIAIDDEDNLYLSCQHTDAVLRFQGDNFQEMEMPTLMPISYGLTKTDRKAAANMTRDNYFPSTFVQFGLPGLHLADQQGIRDIAWVSNANNNSLWVANEDLDKVMVFNSETGNMSLSVSLKKPIGLHYSSAHHAVFVGCKSSKKSAQPAVVVSLNSRTGAQLASYSVLGMKHPSGVTSYLDVLFVADQAERAVHTFNITTGRYITQIIGIETLANYGAIEQMHLSNC